MGVVTLRVEAVICTPSGDQDRRAWCEFDSQLRNEVSFFKDRGSDSVSVRILDPLGSDNLNTTRGIVERALPNATVQVVTKPK